MKKRAVIYFFVPFLAAIILACNLPVAMTRIRIFTTSTPLPSATPISTATPLPSPSPTPVPAAVILEKKVAEENQKDHYTIKSVFPFLQGPETQVGAYNRPLTAFMQQSIQQFRQDAAQVSDIPGSNTGSYLETSYQIRYNQAGLFSIQILTSFYINGAAHPGSYFTTFTYDLRSARMLALADLFQAKSAYLDAIATLCKAELDQRGFPSFSDGSDPKLENYSLWVITPQGLLILFNEYQVAPYAAGPQTVLIPFDRLKAILNASGPINRVLQ